MRRFGLSLLLVTACGTDPVSFDAGVDAGPADVGITRDEIPSMPGSVGDPLDRAGRPFVAELLVGVPSGAAADARADYNTLEPQRVTSLADPLILGTPIQRTTAHYILQSIALYDALDGMCGRGTLVEPDARLERQYRALTALLADDRIWLDTSKSSCNSMFAVERRAFGFAPAPEDDCGGRPPDVDALDAMLELITSTAAKDGIDGDGTPRPDGEPYFDLP